MDPHTPISVEEAIRRVLVHAQPPLRCERLPLTTELLGRMLAEDLVATESFPPFPASIMDGYAVKAPLSAGVYAIASSIHAGATPDPATTSALESGTAVAYITTGAMVPGGANAVVKVEDTELVGEGQVRIKVDVMSPGLNVRQVGSDIERGEVVLQKHQALGPTELGLLATTGFTEVVCYARPVIGVMSSGDELVEASEHTLTGSQIRDCNRLSLLSACREDGFAALDLGIVNDSKEKLRERLLWAAERCDVVVSSGGVSMGAADFIKPLLAEIGTIHFSKLKMKPGKPSTFASIRREGGVDKCGGGVECGKGGERRAGHTTLFFGLPGNPVSCLVTKALFVDVAVRRLQGLSSEASLHPQLTVRLAGADITLDAERPEYHRASLVTAPSTAPTACSSTGASSPSAVAGSSTMEVLAYSTGMQRSSRLLSMRSANALLFLPKGPGVVKVGSLVPALLIRPLQFAPRGVSVHPTAALLDFPSSANSSTCLLSAAKVSGSAEATAHAHHGEASAKGNSKAESSEAQVLVRVGLLTVSDRASEGVYTDASGPEMARLLLEMSEGSVATSGCSGTGQPYPLRFSIRFTAIVPDEPARIAAVVQQWCDPSATGSGAGTGAVDLLLTSGGTGFGPRDLTPEALRPLLHREAPGVAQVLLNEGLKHTPLAVLSRPVVGTRHSTLICTLPGSVKAVRENIVCLKPLMPRIFELLKSGSCSGKVVV